MNDIKLLSLLLYVLPVETKACNMHLLHNCKLLQIVKGAVTEDGFEPLTSRFSKEAGSYGAGLWFMLKKPAFYKSL
jgi:hypothetical protein